LYVKVARPVVGIEEEEAVIQVLRSGWYTSGPSVKEFEQAYAEYIGTKHAAGVSSGTSAIYLTLQALGVGEGDEVIVPALTFFSTASAVLRVGATPIFADIDQDTYCIDYNSICEKMTDETKAVIPVHFYGGMCDMDRIMRLAKQESLLVVEDAAQAHGAEYRGKKAGSFGKAGTWSFFATKNMTTSEESGMVTSDNEDLINMVKVLRSHGMVDRNTHQYLGFNDRMGEISAAIGLVQLGKLDHLNSIRKQNSEYLRERLSDIPWLRIPPIGKHVKHVYFWCPVEVDEQKLGMNTLTLRKTLGESGVETRHRYVEPLYKQPILEQFKHLHDYSKDCLPVAERVAGKMLGLPNHPLLTQEKLDYIIETIKNITSKN